ncbi:MAG: glycoside hydrolase 43 family protein [Bacteroidetes bacterium]|nr:glycoside hydrolase 43 family protein [Bacteroidota bacterium]
MKNITSTFLFLFVALQLMAQQKPFVSQVWCADNGNGTYTNPIIHADYSDPDAIRVGNDYYMTASSFNSSPGLPILHSKDLVNWQIISYALHKQIPIDTFNKPQHGKGVWAPAIRYHNNEFYIFYPDPDFGIYVIKTKNIYGSWSAPKLVLAGKGIIDPCPYWDTDGKAYLIAAWAGSRAGVKSLLTLYKMNNDATAVTDDGKHVFDGHDNHETVEGPKLYKRNGYYYIFAPAGGVGTGWQLVLRSKNIYGPYEEKIVMDKGTTNINGPHQGAWVDTKTGEDWFIHFQDKDAYGRVVHLQPMLWKNNWPVIGVDNDGDGKGEPVITFKKPNVGISYSKACVFDTDEFNTDTLGLQWQWNANYQTQWSALMRGKNYLRLFAINQPKDAANFANTPNLLLQKFPAPNFTATTKLNFNCGNNGCDSKKAGLIVYGEDYAYISIAKKDCGYVLQLNTCTDMLKNSKEKMIEQHLLTSAIVYCKVNVTAPNAMCQFSFSEDGAHFTNIGLPFKAKAGKWVGAKLGLFCSADYGSKVGGFVDVDWFRLSKD